MERPSVPTVSALERWPISAPLERNPPPPVADELRRGRRVLAGLLTEATARTPRVAVDGASWNSGLLSIGTMNTPFV